MIPLHIKLRNFLSYGSYTQTISFEPYHLICLSGKNGHGKSALLDAMTWALWGQARKTLGTAKADEGLLRLGQTHMMVCFDFLCNGKKYRVQREFVCQQNKSHTDLYFGITEKGNETFNSLTEKTTRATQEKIIATLGLSYESCINSVFLRQGQSNEFSSKSAKERKEILATILGINRYEELRAQAQEKVRNITAAHEQLKNLTQYAGTILEQKKKIQEQLVIAKDELEQHDHEQKILQKKTHKLLQETKALQTQLQQKLILETRLQSIQELYQQKWKLLIGLRSNLCAMRKHLSYQSYDEHKKQTLLTQEKEYQKERDALFLLKESLLSAQTAHTEHMQKLAPLQAQQELCMKELDEKRKLYAHHEQALKKLNKLSLDQEIIKEESLFERKKQFYHTWIDHGNRLSNTIKELRHKQILSEQVTSVTCPLCEQTLSSTRKKFLSNKFHDQEMLATHQKNRLTRLLPELKEILIHAHTKLTILKQQQEQQKKLIEACMAITQEIELLHKHKNDLEKNIKQVNSESSEEKIIILQKKISAHIYNAQKHDQLKALIAQMQQQEDLIKDQEVHQATYVQEKKNFFSLCTELKTIRQQCNTLQQELALYTEVVRHEELLKNQYYTLEEQQKKTAQTVIEFLQKKSILEQQLITISEREQEVAHQQQHMKEYEQELDDYQLITQALGKNGIQALLIESAIPELEHEANILLNKLTDNQAHIMIESVRDLKSGGFKETLDIKISDAVGTRPYELFSGGEAFRIDFALRIALSKLLARRSGASLQTLIIDEGFGSQDEEGLSRIMEALYKIQDDFAKIIIVSHLPEMKNQFPTHFFVHKSATGSQISIFEQG